MVLEKTLESPLDCKEIQPVHSEGDQPWNFFGRNDATLQCSCLENPRDGGALWAAVNGVAQSRTQLKQLSSSRRDITGKVMQSSIQEKCFGTEKGREHITWGTRKGLTKEMRSETGLDNELESVCGRGTRGRELLLVEA